MQLVLGELLMSPLRLTEQRSLMVCSTSHIQYLLCPVAKRQPLNLMMFMMIFVLAGESN
jgi:hypothetical protein